MRLAEHEHKGDNEELIAEIVANLQNPTAPVVAAPRPLPT